jgi:hypothetical protein
METHPDFSVPRAANESRPAQGHALAGGAITDGMMQPPCLTLDLLALYMMPDYLNWA